MSDSEYNVSDSSEDETISERITKNKRTKKSKPVAKKIKKGNLFEFLIFFLMI